jgi:hypothetical protein
LDFEVIRRVLAAFEREGVRYAVLGAAALNLHGLARFTEDLDVFLAPEAENIERELPVRPPGVLLTAPVSSARSRSAGNGLPCASSRLNASSESSLPALSAVFGA